MFTFNLTRPNTSFSDGGEAVRLSGTASGSRLGTASKTGSIADLSATQNTNRDLTRKGSSGSMRSIDYSDRFDGSANLRKGVTFNELLESSHLGPGMYGIGTDFR